MIGVTKFRLPSALHKIEMGLLSETIKNGQKRTATPSPLPPIWHTTEEAGDLRGNTAVQHCLSN
ncbi:hypothetical protein GsuE55_18760 [Geobacillus subterraneus]|uniref:Uncharacterized protein n=1 Tax=Geobacillus subterraneus TaxID=129338 RepID=A0A679FM61_9BACL|nr:hypothetical protein GsuE55_18760 [Geobacillus subterraneus]